MGTQWVEQQPLIGTLFTLILKKSCLNLDTSGRFYPACSLVAGSFYPAALFFDKLNKLKS